MKKQSVKREIWYIAGRRKRRKGDALPLAALVAPILGYLGSIAFKKISTGKIRRRHRYG